MHVRELILDAISKATGIKDPHLDFSSREEFGDYTSNIAIQNKLNVKEIVAKLKKDKKLKDVVSKISSAGPGFINFHLSTKVLTSNLSHIIEDKSKYGYSTAGKGKKVIVEYSSPNIAKPFTVGHLRSTIIGDAIANLLEAIGYEVYRDNHLGDWGTQFGKQIYAIKTWGNEEEIEKSTSPVKELVALYVRFHKESEKDPSLEEEARKWFKKLEDGDVEARRLWQKCIDWSWKEFSRIYKELGVRFTENDGKGYGESYFESRMQLVIKELRDKGLLKEGEEGAKLVFFEKDKLPPLMILKKDGATLYATRDLATDKFRKEKYDPDLIINEVGIEQALYFKQLFEVEYMLGWYKEGQRVHIGHGHFRFKEGKMSTRKGNVIWLEDVLRESIERASKFNTSVAKEVAIGSIKYNDLKRDYKQDVVFDWDEILNMQGNSGPYLQYTVARANSVIGKAKKAKLKIADKLEAEESSVLRELIKFSEIVEMAALKYSPNLLCEYLYNLAQKYNTFYNKLKIIGSEEEGFRVGLTTATGQVIKNGLKLLGIEAPVKM